MSYKEFKKYVDDNTFDYQFINYDSKEKKDQKIKIIKAKIIGDIKLY